MTTRVKHGAATIMATDGGAHSHESWAEVTATHVVAISESMDPIRRQLAFGLRAKVALLLSPHHEAHQKHERTQLAEKGAAHLDTTLEHCSDRAATAMKEIEKAAEGTPWEDHFKLPTGTPEDGLSAALDAASVPYASFAAEGLDRHDWSVTLKDGLTPQDAEHFSALASSIVDDVHARFARPVHLHRLVARHFRTSAHAEREWHCHRNTDCAESQKWLKKSRSHGLGHLHGEGLKAARAAKKGTLMSGIAILAVAGLASLLAHASLVPLFAAFTITSCLPDSFRKELMTASHNFAASGGHTFNTGLFKANASLGRSYAKSTTNYSTITAATSDELANGSGYTTAGVAMTNVDPTTGSNVAYTDWSNDPQWTGATFTTAGMFVYNTSASNKIVLLIDFGGDQAVSGTLTIVLPAAASGTAIIRIS